MSRTIPYGYCQCGCGQKTKLAVRTVSSRGWIKDEPLRFISGHNKARLTLPKDVILKKNEKWCPACKKAKNKKEFGPDKGNKDELSGRCRSCDSKRVSKYQHEHLPERRAYLKKWYWKNVETYRPYNAAKNKRWREANPERAKEIWNRWAEKNPDVLRANVQKRRATLLRAFVEDVNPSEVFKRDKGICGICGMEVSSDSFDIDHIIPLSKGGKHSNTNAQLSHVKCNRWKSSRMVVVENGEWFFKKKKDEDSFGRFLERL